VKRVTSVAAFLPRPRGDDAFLAVWTDGLVAAISHPLRLRQGNAQHLVAHRWSPANSALLYVEYGMSLLDALQLWRNALQDQAGPVAAYRRDLAAGGMGRSLRGLCADMGMESSLDAGMLREMVALVEEQLRGLRE